jgi:transposase-like protein
VHIIKKYTPAFKQKVINEIASGRFSSFEEAKMHYGINGSSTLRRWAFKMGRQELLPKVLVIDVDK